MDTFCVNSSCHMNNLLLFRNFSFYTNLIGFVT